MDRKKKKSSLGGIVGTIVLILLSIAGNGDGAVAAAILILIAVAAAMFFVGKKIFEAVNVSGESPVNGARKLFESAAWNRDVPPEDETFVARSPEIRSYDENAAERNFIRDKERRIKQLDVFLKNGIIDKEEYKFLRNRYEKSYY